STTRFNFANDFSVQYQTGLSPGKRKRLPRIQAGCRYGRKWCVVASMAIYKSALDIAGDCGSGAADRLRESGESDVGASQLSKTRDCCQACAWRITRASDESVADRESVACDSRRPSGNFSCWFLKRVPRQIHGHESNSGN